MGKDKKLKKRLGAADLSILCAQIGLFLRSGISLLNGLELIRDEANGRRIQKATDMLVETVGDRKTLSEAMSLCGVFPDYLVKMTEVGETSGELDSVMESMARFYEREQRLNDQIKNSVMYPLTLIVMMGVVVFALIVQVLPMFCDILTELGGEIPGLINALINFGSFLRQNYIIILSVIVLLVLFYQVFKRTAAGSFFVDKSKATLPLLRSLHSKIAAERFAGAMTFLLSSGVDMEKTLDISQDILNNKYMAKKITASRQEMTRGVAVYDVLNNAGIFPGKFTKMLSIGFQSGEADSVMENLANTYEHEVDKSLNKIAGSIEPVLAAILSIIVGVILISVILPLISIMSLIG